MARTPKQIKAPTEPNRTQKPIERTIRFRFVADKFGFLPDSEPLQIEYARKATRAISSWQDTIADLFGDTSMGLDAATSARILPQFPKWSTVAQALEHLRGWLGGLGAAGAGQSNVEAIVDPATQDAVEQVRIYLGVIHEWARTFRAGIWVAGVGAMGSAEAAPSARLLRGLISLGKVYEFDASFTPARIWEEFKALVLSGELQASLPDFRGLWPHFEVGTKAILYSLEPPDFARDPEQLTEWLISVHDEAKHYGHHEPIGAGDAWNSIEDAYWSQWTWPSIGAVQRKTPGPSNAPAVSALDLIYTTRYGSLPLLHWRGGTLSICQWSRILRIARYRRRGAFENPQYAGLSNLGLPTEYLSKEATQKPKYPLVTIAVYSELSPAWAWRPEPDVRSFAFIPRERADADESAARHGESDGSTSQALEATGWVEALSKALDISAPRIRCTEVVGGQEAKASRADSMVGPAGHRVYFGYEAASGDYEPFVASPRSVRELIAQLEGTRPEWFPRLLEQKTGWSRVVYLSRMYLRAAWSFYARPFARLLRQLRPAGREMIIFMSRLARRYQR